MSPRLLNPHRWIRARGARDAFLIELLDALWAGYRARMAHVVAYEELIQARGATFLNDHVAFRSFAAQRPAVGIASVSRPFEALGYAPAGAYVFADKKLTSIHFVPPRPEFPKVFVSQLHTWELSPEGRKAVRASLKTHRPPLSDETLAGLRDLEGASVRRRAALMKELLRHFQELPWDLPQKKEVVALDRESQFGAWVLVNGYGVNHFTASVDSHGVSALNDVEKVQAALASAGVPMKKEIEGRRGDPLRQTATEAVVVPTPVRDGRSVVRIPWTYAYFELAERPRLKNPVTGRVERFDGFLGPQATNLFDMTRRRA